MPLHRVGQGEGGAEARQPRCPPRRGRIGPGHRAGRPGRKPADPGDRARRGRLADAAEGEAARAGRRRFPQVGQRRRLRSPRRLHDRRRRDGSAEWWSLRPFAPPRHSSRPVRRRRRSMRSINDQAAGKRAGDPARGRPADPDPPPLLRPDRPAADARGGRRVPRRHRARRLRAAGRPPARLAPLRRALGAALDGPRPLRRDPRPRPGPHPPQRLALPRLPDRVVQPRHAVRPVRPRSRSPPTSSSPTSRG